MAYINSSCMSVKAECVNISKLDSCIEQFADNCNCTAVTVASGEGRFSKLKIINNHCATNFKFFNFRRNLNCFQKILVR